MADQPPAHYNDADPEQAPAYNSSSDIAARWHIINTPAKGFYGSRGISFVSDLLATTNPPSAEQLPVGLGYHLLFVDSSQLEVHPRAPPKERSGSSSEEPWKTPVLAKVLFSHQNPRQATIEFAGEHKTKITIDAGDLGPDLLSFQPITTNMPTHVTMYHMFGKPNILPVCWSVEANKNVNVDPLDSEVKNPYIAGTPSNPDPVQTESTKKSWKTKMKEAIGAKPFTPEQTRTSDEKLKRQRRSLNSNFTLQDSQAKVHAYFHNEFFKDAATFTKLPTYQKTAKQHKSWGHLDLNASYYAFLRSRYPAFEKWNDSNLEMLALLTLTVILEINIKINGGVVPGSPFSSSLTVMTAGDPRSEGLPGYVGAALGVLSKGVQGLGNSNIGG